MAETEEVVETVQEVLAEVGTRLYSGREMGIVVGVAAGLVMFSGFMGYRFAEKKLSVKFEALMEEETSKLREHYIQKARAKAEKPTHEELAELAENLRARPVAEEIIAEAGYKPTADEMIQRAKEKAAGIAREQHAIEQANKAAEAEAPVSTESETQNIFQERDKAKPDLGEWDYSKELKSRDPREPYVIHIDEWQENASEYEKTDLTFYEGDEVLSDDNDTVIAELDEAIGFDNLTKFGHGSGDPNVVFIRNDVREVLYEVARSYGSYSLEVHGLDPTDHLKHSDERRRDRRRFDDD